MASPSVAPLTTPLVHSNEPIRQLSDSARSWRTGVSPCSHQSSLRAEPAQIDMVCTGTRRSRLNPLLSLAAHILGMAARSWLFLELLRAFLVHLWRMFSQRFTAYRARGIGRNWPPSRLARNDLKSKNILRGFVHFYPTVTTTELASRLTSLARQLWAAFHSNRRFHSLDCRGDPSSPKRPLCISQGSGE